jgi:hypothetical protein
LQNASYLLSAAGAASRFIEVLMIRAGRRGGAPLPRALDVNGDPRALSIRFELPFEAQV